MPGFLKALLQSRKFWMAFLAFIGSTILYVQGALPAEQYVQAITTLASLLVGSIALEDAAEKYGKS